MKDKIQFFCIGEIVSFIETVLASISMTFHGRISGGLCQNCFYPDAHPVGKFKLKWPPITRST